MPLVKEDKMKEWKIKRSCNEIDDLLSEEDSIHIHIKSTAFGELTELFHKFGEKYG